MVKAAAFKSSTPVVCVNVFDTNYSYLVAHVENRIAVGTTVTGGQTQLGTVEPPRYPRYLPGNNNISHIHFQLYSKPNCPTVDSDVPFDSGAGGLDLDGEAFPGSANGGQHTGRLIQ